MPSVRKSERMGFDFDEINQSPKNIEKIHIILILGDNYVDLRGGQINGQQ